jgi:hypothetical protein
VAVTASGLVQEKDSLLKDWIANRMNRESAKTKIGMVQNHSELD